MKTATIEVTPGDLAAFVTLVDAGLKNERLGGIMLWSPGARCAQLLAIAQMAFDEPPVETEEEPI